MERARQTLHHRRCTSILAISPATCRKTRRAAPDAFAQSTIPCTGPPILSAILDLLRYGETCVSDPDLGSPAPNHSRSLSSPDCAAPQPCSRCASFRPHYRNAHADHWQQQQ